MKFNHLLCAGLLGASTVQACELQLSQGDIDYGQLNRTTLKAQEGKWRLAPRHITLQVRCEAPTDMALTFSALARGQQAFALGERGEYRLTLGQAQLDGEPVALGLRGGQAITSVAVEQALRPQQAVVPVRAGAAVQGRYFSAQVWVHALADERALQVTDATVWQAAGLFEVAGQQRELALRAGFAPAACQPRLGEGGRVDFGRIAARRLAPDSQTRLTRHLPLSVSCEGPTRFALSATDNRAATMLVVEGQARGNVFGVGQGAGGYVASVGNDALGDGAPLTAVYGRPGGVQWQASHRAAGSALYHDGLLLGFADEHRQALGPVAISQLNATLAIDLYLAPMRQWALTEEVPLDGAATLEIIYL
ncbi:MAG: DUF1120 domain-containing protein [Pseudomonas sp.]|nr:DUF1120 domain-containing protein [Pseudomonas sp.]